MSVGVTTIELEPRHEPLVQKSLLVQTLPSSHASELFAY
jgi:hypothetical protein